MTAEVGTPPPASGFIERAFTRWLMRAAQVSQVESLSPHFRFVDFEGEALKDCAWKPGQKIQIKMGSGLATRTYTPIQWDGSRGTTRILAYAHGVGPGSDWTHAARVGSPEQIFGPRRSLDLDGLPDSVVLFGDETSFGLAAALRAQRAPSAALHCVFEVTSAAESTAILERLTLGTVRVVERQADEAHLSEVTEALLQHLDGAGHGVLTGKSTSVKQLGRALKARGIERDRVRAKVYWAPGKTGLD